MLLPALMANRVSGQDISNLIRNEVACLLQRQRLCTAICTRIPNCH